MEGEAAVAVGGEKELGNVFLLATEGVTHAVPGLGDVGEGDGAPREGKRLSRALDILMSHFD